MKKMMMALVLLAGMSAQASQICTEVDNDGIGGAISTNFDGSISIRNPKLMMDGKYTFLTWSNDSKVDYATRIKNSARGLCKALGKSKMVDVSTTLNTGESDKLALTVDGKVDEVYNTIRRIEKVVCE